jgi:Glycerophosphoryl diester phosphodiesterase
MTQEPSVNPLISAALIDALLPGAGFFGASPENCLNLEVNAVIDRVEISIEAPAAEILNIGEINLKGADGIFIPKLESCARIEMSSIYGDSTLEKCFDDFVAGRLLHTKLESRPCVQIFLKSPTFVRGVMIKNRGDVYGCRSKYLVMRAFCGQNLVSEYQNLNPEEAKRDVEQLLGELGLIDKLPGSEKELVSFVRDARRIIKNRVEANTIDLSLRQVYHLLPVMSVNREVTNYHLTLCALAVLLQWEDRDHVATKFLRSFASILRTDISIEKLANEVERLSRSRLGSDRKVVIGRHIIKESVLTSRKDAILQRMREVIEILSGVGVTTMLGYGTLLGAVRDGAFLPHDDDVDLMIFDGASSEEEAVACKNKVIEALAKRGIGARESGFGHLHIIGNDPIDIFPIWQEGDRAYLAMESLRVRDVPFDQLFPVTAVNLYGQAFPAPAKPEAFLANRYGEGWRYPDPYYEWPWQIERILTRIPQAVRTAVERRSMQPRRHWGRLCRVAWGQKVKRGEVSPPMNCLPTVMVAREAGYDAVELDVRVSADGVPVLAHDDRLMGPDGDVVVTQSPLERLQRFRLGTFEGEDVFIPTLEAALVYANELDLDVQIDARINADQVPLLRASVNRAEYDPTRLQFCVYNIAQAHALLANFPESVLMWKTYRPFLDVDEYFLDEAKALGLDGVMLSVPPKGEDYSGFMKSLRERGLRVLFFIHSGDDAVLEKMVRNGVDYVTTIASESLVFKQVQCGWMN